VVADPEVKPAGVGGTANDVTVNLSAWGVGFTYYVMPAAAPDDQDTRFPRSS